MMRCWLIDGAMLACLGRGPGNKTEVIADRWPTTIWFEPGDLLTNTASLQLNFGVTGDRQRANRV